MQVGWIPNRANGNNAHRKWGIEDEKNARIRRMRNENGNVADGRLPDNRRHLGEAKKAVCRNNRTNARDWNERTPRLWEEISRNGYGKKTIINVLSQALQNLDYSSKSIIPILVVKNDEQNWLAPIMKKLNSILRPKLVIWNIPRIYIINEDIARQRHLVKWYGVYIYLNLTLKRVGFIISCSFLCEFNYGERRWNNQLTYMIVLHYSCLFRKDIYWFIFTWRSAIQIRCLS